MLYFLIFLVVNILITSSQCSVNRVLYDQSGEYVLNPEDYNYSQNIIIYMSGSGSGSTYFYQDGIIWYCPGNSGSYASFNLETYNRTFSFTLGAGGYSITNNNHIEHEVNGNCSSFTFTDSKGDDLVLLVPGGNANGTSSRPTFSGKLDSLTRKQREVDLFSNLVLSPGVVFNCYAWNNIPNGGYGAYSKLGHEGGNLHADPPCDGYLGSGSGYDCCYCKVDEHKSCIRPYKGGDAALVLYF